MKFPILLVCSTLIALNGVAQLGTLKVQGESIQYASPEELHIQIPIAAKHASYEACAKALTMTYNDLEAALEKSGIKREQVRASGLNIQENYTWVDRERKSDGYQGNISATIRIPHTTEMLNAFMKTMADERFTFGYNLNFALSETQKQTLQKEAIAAAANDAKAKAIALAASLEVKLLNIQAINYGNTQGSNDMLMMRAESKMSADMEQVELNPNFIEVRKTVDVTWNIVP